MVDGKGFIEYLCEDCKINIAKQTAKLGLLDQLRPQRVAKKSLSWICKDCRKNLEKAIKKK